MRPKSRKVDSLIMLKWRRSLTSKPSAVASRATSEWKDFEYFEESWENRVIALASMIRCQGAVVDFGCGQQLLRKHLPAGMHYIPVDYTSRSPDTIVCDFNKSSYPELTADVAFISGFLEYIIDVDAFVAYLTRLPLREVLVSYCALESVTSLEERRLLGWKNNMHLKDVLVRFLKHFSLDGIDIIDRNTLLRFERRAR
jgi:hypothetical protein